MIISCRCEYIPHSDCAVIDRSVARDRTPFWLAAMKGRKWVLAAHFRGFPKVNDLELVEEELPDLKDGGKFAYLLNGTVN